MIRTVLALVIAASFMTFSMPSAAEAALSKETSVSKMMKTKKKKKSKKKHDKVAKKKKKKHHQTV